MCWDDLSESERGYIAGFLDGEGSILLTKNNIPGSALKCRPTISFYNTNKEVVDWIASVIGVKTNTRMEDLRRDSRHKKTNYTISIRKSSEVYKFLLQIHPYLRVKQKNADIVMKFCEDVLSRENWQFNESQLVLSEEYYNKLKKITAYVGGD